jgi:hypothetical protein
VSGPGDRAPKHPLRGEPTPSDQAEGHGGGPKNVGMDLPLSPGSWSSARLHMPHAREPGDLEGCSPPVVGGGQPREGKTPHAAGAPKAQPFEESDAGVVPEKSAKTWVTPVEPMEERPKAKGNPLNVNARRTLGRVRASLRGAGRTARGGGRRNDHRPVHHRRSSLISRLRRPKVGARCGKSARRVLSGGRPERAVPTGTGKQRRAWVQRPAATAARSLPRDWGWTAWLDPGAFSV